MTSTLYQLHHTEWCKQPCTRAAVVFTLAVRYQERHQEMKRCAVRDPPTFLFTCLCCIAVALDKGRGGSSHGIRPLLMCSLNGSRLYSTGISLASVKGGCGLCTCSVTCLCVCFHCFCCPKGGSGVALAWQDEEMAIHY